MYDDIVAVAENRPLTGGHFLLGLHTPRQAQAVRAGQFAMVRLLDRSDVLLRRPMSIYDVKSGREAASAGQSARLAGADKLPVPARPPQTIQLLYKVVGRGTRLMAELKPGDRVGLIAPLGHGFFPEEFVAQAKNADEILHVAGGIGIAALLMPAKQLAAAGFKQRLFFGGRTKNDLVGVADFKPLVTGVALATEDGSKGHHGYVTKPFRDFLQKNRGGRFLVMGCGPWAMLEASAALAKKFGHPCLVSMENRMGCGLGVCLGCSIRVDGSGHGAYQRVCTEGPVFWADKVIF